MKWPHLVVPLLMSGASACKDRDLWADFERAPTTALPVGHQIELACAQANARFKSEAEKTPRTYIDPDYAHHPVRRIRCQWEQGAEATAQCQFEETSIGWEADPAKVLPRLTDRDWTPMRARLIHVLGPINNGGGWIAPRGCNTSPDAR